MCLFDYIASSFIQIKLIRNYVSYVAMFSFHGNNDYFVVFFFLNYTNVYKLIQLMLGSDFLM